MAVATAGAVGFVCGLFVGRWEPLREAPRAAARAMPRVAVLIDDCGYHDSTFALYRAIKPPLTLAVLPQLPYSRAVADLAAERRFETMLHLPMEPRAGQVPERGLERHTITTRMSREDVRRHLASALESVPQARGVNNHMGSKATANVALMRTVLEELKSRRLFFVDSLVTTESVGAQVAREVGIRFGRRAVFLDNESRPAYIKGQLSKLVARAKREGQAIGIGHDRPATLRVLQDALPQLAGQGVRLVYVSEVVQTVSR